MQRDMRLKRLCQIQSIRNILITIIFIIVTGSVAYSSEGGGSTYPLGFLGVSSGIQPAPGSYLTQVTTYYTGDSVFVTELGKIQTNTHLNSFAEISLFQQVTKTRVLNSNYGWGIVGSLVKNEVSGQVVMPIEIPSFNSSITGAGTVVLIPMTLGWDNGRSHQRIYSAVYTPLGNYNVKRLVATSLNHWAFEIDYAFTFKDPKTRFEFTVVPGYTVNAVNHTTNYHDGQELHIDYSAIKRFPTSLGLGITGYTFQQITPDSGSGALLGALKGQAFALGPAVLYDAKVGDTTISLLGKYFKEFGNKNRFEGQAFWLDMTISF